jgi:hypothetical protein
MEDDVKLSTLELNGLWLNAKELVELRDTARATRAPQIPLFVSDSPIALFM